MKMPGAPHTSRWGQAGGIYKEGLAHRPILSAQPQALPAQGPLGYLVNLGFFFFFLPLMACVILVPGRISQGEQAVCLCLF